MSDHFAQNSALIAALAPTDPEALAAVAHARTCPTCAEALAEGRRLMRLLDALPPPPPLPVEVLERTAAALEREAQQQRRARSPVFPAAAVVAAWTLELVIAKHRDGARLGVVEAALALAVAVGVAALSGVRARVAAAAGVVASAALVWVAATGTGFAPAVGVKCTVLELVGAAIPFATAAWLARRGRAPLGAWRGAGVASAGALAAQATLHLTCKVAHQGPHLVAFHLGGVMLAAVAGYGVGQIVTRRQQRAEEL